MMCIIIQGFFPLINLGTGYSSVNSEFSLFVTIIKPLNAAINNSVSM